jgi:hypothetical protein
VLVVTPRFTGVPDGGVTVYPVIGELPFEMGGCQLRLTVPSPGIALTFCGGPGTATGTTALDAADAGPEPTTLVAVTVNVYELPLVSPETTTEVAGPATVATAVPGDALTW